MRKFLVGLAVLIIYSLGVCCCVSSYEVERKKEYQKKTTERDSIFRKEEERSQLFIGSIERKILWRAKEEEERYKITEEEHKSIEGISYIRTRVFHKEETITLSIYNKKGTSDFSFGIGADKDYLKSIKIRIDDGEVFTLVGEITRKILTFHLEKSIIDSLKECNLLFMEIDEKLLEIPIEGIERIKEFLLEENDE